MATITNNQDVTLTVTLSGLEQNAYAWIEAERRGAFESYVTQWIKDRGREMFIEKFLKLSAQEKQDVLALLK